MEFTVSRSNLLKELNFLQSVVEKKSTIPIIQNLYIRAAKGEPLTLVGTDLESTLRCSCPAEIKAGGVLLLPAKRLFDIVRSLPDAEIHIKTDGQDHAVITCERSRFKLLSPDAETFPEIATVPKAQFSVSAAVFRTMIPRTVFAATQEESRFALNGAQMILTANSLRMVATDGHRLAYIEKPGLEFKLPKDGLKVLIPKKTLSEVLKLAADAEDEAVSFGKDDNHIFFHAGSRLYISRMLAGQFPNYEMVMPKENDKTLVFESDRLMAALRRVSFMADDVTRAVRMHIGEGKVEITAQSSESGEASETVPVEFSEKNYTIAFNVQYLLEFLSVAASTEARFEFKDEGTQIQMRPKDDGEYDYRYVVMPMRA
ncbi:MAG: DNA polymerase III subunit beta [Blastocatellia bacterium]|nr:DNA polymerase III subunit beta [Blastocatellia bacterium]